MKDVECPYCEEPQYICHDDGYGYEQETIHTQRCGKCNKIFVYETEISFYYTASQADCLNDGEHDYQLTTTSPKEFSRMRCTFCDDVRQLTKEEREQYDIQSEADYFKNIKWTNPPH